MLRLVDRCGYHHVAMDTFDELPVLHTRNYDTTVYRNGEELKAVGSVRDVKPAGLYIRDDVDPLTIHDMRVVLDISIENLSIVKADVAFGVYPNTACPSIIDHYDKLVGLNVARGFSRKVRELFGGPRGCTHTTALLQAMAPVVVQSLWSMELSHRRESGKPVSGRTPDQMKATIERNVNTCHVWDEDGEHVERARSGSWRGAPLWAEERLVQLGRSVDEWPS